MYSHDDLFEIVKKYMSEEYDTEIYDAKKTPGKGGMYSDEEAKAAAKELVSMLEDAFVNAQIHGDEGMWGGGYEPVARVAYKIKKSSTGQPVIHVVFPGKYLFRPSLFKTAGGWSRTGGGIDDIFSLFTSGYSHNKRFPSGYWFSDARQIELSMKPELWEKKVRAPSDYPAHPFISRTIEEFERSHPGIRVEYPEEWHG